VEWLITADASCAPLKLADVYSGDQLSQNVDECVAVHFSVDFP
jgi:hypothetical protein